MGARKVYKELKEKFEKSKQKKMKNINTVIQIGSATCELAANADAVKKEFTKLLKASGRTDIKIKQTGCTGRCAREPIVGVFVEGEFPYKYEEVSIDKVQEIFNNHVIGGQPMPELLLDKKSEKLYSYSVTICSSTLCDSTSDTNWQKKFQERLAALGVKPDNVKVLQGGCMGLCPSEEQRGKAVNMMVFPQRITYQFRSVDELDTIITEQFLNHRPCKQFITQLDPLTNFFMYTYGDVAFFNKQTRLTLRNSGLIDPESLEDYILNKGYEGLSKILDSNKRIDFINEVEQAGLRGRGGAGFPTNKKWLFAYNETRNPKYVVCNADEGDPGAFMDRSALEGDPFSIIEGMTIGAYAIGSNQGYLYIRAEYPLAIERIQFAIEKARQANLLGENVLGTDFNFDLEIRLGAGAYVCGEETALMRSIEGKRGQPTIRPPFPTESGLWGNPTLINNVETWANIPVIALYGAKWFSQIGTTKSKGTKVFALAGKVNNTGLIEVPMGTSLNDIIHDVGGGISNSRKLKAVQTGGPSGGCIPAELMDTPVDYESLQGIGSMMGSGGMIVLDDEDCMVSTARFFLEFTRSESCGKCVPCREGSLRMLEILDRIIAGKGVPEDLSKLKRLAHLIQKTSLCGLGQAAPNPVLSSLANFKDEYIAHIEDKKCQALKCTNLITYRILEDKCTGCTLCARYCPVPCISGSPGQVHKIDQSKCIKCGECYRVCRFNAVEKT